MADEFVEEVGRLLTEFATDPSNETLLARARDFDWLNAPWEERQALNDAFMQAPTMQAVRRVTSRFGWPAEGIGGMVSGQFLAGGGGGGGVLTHLESGEAGGVGFAFGSAGAAIGGAASFVFILYKSKPSDWWGLFHGAYAHVHLGVGLGVYTCHLGAGYDSRWEALLFAVGVGVGGGAGGFLGGAWRS
ncbi:MAG: hypothetical protein NVSMB32_17870 [Actinomycetota bacterium]